MTNSEPLPQGGEGEDKGVIRKYRTPLPGFSIDLPSNHKGFSAFYPKIYYISCQEQQK